jgi:hypothetical protein
MPVEKPHIIPREEWGARQVGGIASAPKTAVSIHHMVVENGVLDPEAEKAILRRIQNDHMDNRDFSDMGEQLNVMQSGRIYEGRRPLTANGAVVHNCNSFVIGIECQGDFRAFEPPEPMLEALTRLLAWLCTPGVLSAGGIDPLERSNVRAGIWPHQAYAPFGSFNNTECCGTRLVQRIPELRTGTADLMDTSPPPWGSLPFSETLRLTLAPPGQAGRTWAGWPEAGPALKWIAEHGVKAGTKAALAWRNHIWRGPEAVTDVARALIAKHLGE